MARGAGHGPRIQVFPTVCSIAAPIQTRCVARFLHTRARLMDRGYAHSFALLRAKFFLHPLCATVRRRCLTGHDNARNSTSLTAIELLK